MGLGKKETTLGATAAQRALSKEELEEANL